ncbi:unnamed protein product [Hyaloperonospora brassicae]|uniref:Uncharacterized protein n=1 Tax=Hyaloperonospora brassicae TaxID=162125 RepID=A0AAV0UMI6_HYABA|nr:unnamed protein product [Hyaloperonospora brassicae]
MSSAVPTTGLSTSGTPWRSRAKAEPQRTAHTSLGSWFLSKFTGAYKGKTKFLRDHEEEAATGTARTTAAGATATAVRRRPVGTLSAVTNQQQANAARRGEMGQAPSTLRRQQSFLRQQLLEMKQQSAETLARAQKRINGELMDDERGDDETRDSDADSDKDKDECGEEEEEEDDDDEGRARGGGTGAAATGFVDAARESWSSDPARSRSSSCRRSRTSMRRRSAAEEQQERDDEMLAHEVQRDEYSEEADRRMSQATQLYAEAISALDFALRPGRKRHHSEPSPKPLLLGVKRGSPNMPKSEWV